MWQLCWQNGCNAMISSFLPPSLTTALSFLARPSTDRESRRDRHAAGRLQIASTIGVLGLALTGLSGQSQAQTFPPIVVAGPAKAAPSADQPMQIPDYRGALRDIVRELSNYAKGRNPNFLILTREGLGLTIKEKREATVEAMTQGQDAPPSLPVGSPHRRYVKAIDGVVMNDQYCVPQPDSTASSGFIGMLEKNGLTVLSVDHCASAQQQQDAYLKAQNDRVLAYADMGKGPQNRVPRDPFVGENPANIDSLADAQNILFLDGNDGYASKDDMLVALAQTNWDVLVLDAFVRDRTPFSPADVQRLKFKKLGTRRLVLTRLDIGHASDTRYYWKEAWKVGDPAWITAPIIKKPGLYTVAFWDPEWRAIAGRTFAALMDLGFDGVVIEGVDAYKPLEAKDPIDQ